MTAEIVALAQEQKQIATLLAKVKPEKARAKFVEQLVAMECPLRRIKLKVFGHSGWWQMAMNTLKSQNILQEPASPD